MLPQQFGLAEAEELLYLAIRPDQKTLGVDDHDGVRSFFGQRPHDRIGGITPEGDPTGRTAFDGLATVIDRRVWAPTFPFAQAVCMRTRSRTAGTWLTPAASEASRRRRQFQPRPHRRRGPILVPRLLLLLAPLISPQGRRAP